MPITTMHPDDIRAHPLNVRRTVAAAGLDALAHLAEQEASDVDA